MRVMAQMGMVMNLDKCIGCHTCSVTCKQAWTNRAGTEYVWFNNVETRPGLGYPRGYEDQEEWLGGWVAKDGKLSLRAGGRLRKLLTIFSNPKMPSIKDYYEPWTYDYETLLNAPVQKNFPVARPYSLISGKPMNVSWRLRRVSASRVRLRYSADAELSSRASALRPRISCSNPLSSRSAVWNSCDSTYAGAAVARSPAVNASVTMANFSLQPR